MTKIEITLQNPLNKSQTHNIWLDVFDTPVAQKWVNQLKVLLRDKKYLEKNFCFIGFPWSPRNLEYLCHEMNQHIEQINHFADNGKWSTPYRISERFYPETVFKDRQLSQPLMNAIHHHFEILQGLSWNISPYYIEADDQTKFSIRTLNLLCHEIEAFCHSYKVYLDGSFEYIYPASIVGFVDCLKEDLTEEDNQHFKLEKGFGLVHLHYSQVGKTHWEAFEHNDEMVFDETIRGLKSLTGEFNILWGNESQASWIENKKQLDHWLRAQGQNPNDPNLALGWLYVAAVNVEKSFGARSITEIQKFLSDFLDIFEIKVIEENEIISCQYPYTIYDSDYSRRQFDSLKESFDRLIQREEIL